MRPPLQCRAASAKVAFCVSGSEPTTVDLSSLPGSGILDRFLERAATAVGRQNLIRVCGVLAGLIRPASDLERVPLPRRSVLYPTPCPGASEICALPDAETRFLGDTCFTGHRDPVPRRYVLNTMRQPGSTITNGWLLDVRRYGCNIGTPQVS